MNWRNFFKLGLVALLLVFALPVLNTSLHLAESNRLNSWSGNIMRVAAILLAIAGVLYLLEKLGMKVSGARCRVCKKRVPHGFAYCRDHLRTMVHDAQAKYHGQRGMGI